MADQDTSIVSSLALPMLVVEEDGTVRWVNSAASLFWRQSATRLAGYAVTRLFGGDPRVARAVARAVKEEAPSTITALVMEQGAGLDPLTLSVQVDPLMVPDRPVRQAVVAVWDETNRVRLERETHAEHQMASIGALARRLAHELQNPLSGIKGSAQLLTRKLGDTPGSADYLKVMLREMNRMERLIKDLLIYGDNPPLNPRSFNLHELLDEVLWFVSNSESRVNLERDYDPSLPNLVADRDRMQQVYLNLVRNAVEASPVEGTIFIRTGMTGPWGAEPSAVSEVGGIHFRVEIEDQGPGVSADARERLFTPFFTTKKNGTGLGLSICYQLVRLHGGSLRYRRGNQGGAVFSVYIPMVRE